MRGMMTQEGPAPALSRVRSRLQWVRGESPQRLGASALRHTTKNYVICRRAYGVKSMRPNIVFIMSDDHAAHAISAYESTVNRTPHLDRLADQGVRMDATYCTNSICSPSRASILTGTYSHVNGVASIFTQIDYRVPTFAEVLRDAGYQTALFGKWHLGERAESAPRHFDAWKVFPGHYTRTGDVRELLAAGVNCFLGTDGFMTVYSRCGTTDMLLAMWLLALITRLTGDADYEEIFAKGGGILSSVRQTRQVSEDELHAQSLARLRRMRAAGTTTLEIKSGYGLTPEHEAKMLRAARAAARRSGRGGVCLDLNQCSAAGRQSTGDRD